MSRYRSPSPTKQKALNDFVAALMSISQELRAHPSLASTGWAKELRAEEWLKKGKELSYANREVEAHQATLFKREEDMRFYNRELETLKNGFRALPEHKKATQLHNSVCAQSMKAAQECGDVVRNHRILCQSKPRFADRAQRDTAQNTKYGALRQWWNDVTGYTAFRTRFTRLLALKDENAATLEECQRREKEVKDRLSAIEQQWAMGNASVIAEAERAATTAQKSVNSAKQKLNDSTLQAKTLKNSVQAHFKGIFGKKLSASTQAIVSEHLAKARANPAARNAYIAASSTSNEDDLMLYTALSVWSSDGSSYDAIRPALAECMTVGNGFTTNDMREYGLCEPSHSSHTNHHSSSSHSGWHSHDQSSSYDHSSSHSSHDYSSHSHHDTSSYSSHSDTSSSFGFD